MEDLTRIGPLAVFLLVLFTESISSPRREDKTEVGRNSLDGSQAEESLEGHHLGDLSSGIEGRGG
jgi:hypothetical protein